MKKHSFIKEAKLHFSDAPQDIQFQDYVKYLESWEIISYLAKCLVSNDISDDDEEFTMGILKQIAAKLNKQKKQELALAQTVKDKRKKIPFGDRVLANKLINILAKHYLDFQKDKITKEELQVRISKIKSPLLADYFFPSDIDTSKENFSTPYLGYQLRKKKYHLNEIPADKLQRLVPSKQFIKVSTGPKQTAAKLCAKYIKGMGTEAQLMSKNKFMPKQKLSEGFTQEDLNKIITQITYVHAGANSDTTTYHYPSYQSLLAEDSQVFLALDKKCLK